MSTGLRRAEVVALRWDDIDFENQTVTVRHGKSDKQRVAAIADFLAVNGMSTIEFADLICEGLG